MPTDSSGNYSLPGSYFVQTGDDVLPEQHNPPLEDVAAGLTARLMADGRKVWTGDQKAGGNKLTGLGAGVAPDDAATVAQVGTLTNLPEIIKTDDYTITTADAGKAIVANKATAITFMLPALSSAGTKPYIVRNIGAGDLTLDGNASEQIEGASAITIRQGGAALVWPNGSLWRAFRSFPVSGQAATGDIADDAVTLGKMEHGTQGDLLYYGASGVPTRLPAGTNGQFLRTKGAGQNPEWGGASPAINYNRYDTPGTVAWNKPSGFSDDALAYMRGWGSGASGAIGATSANPAGAGAAYDELFVRLGDLPSTVNVTVGEGSQTADKDGEATSFGTLLVIAGGKARVNNVGGVGGDRFSIGDAFKGGAGGDGSNPGKDSVYGGGGGGANSNGGNSIYGGGGGAAGRVGAGPNRTKGTSRYGGDGGAGQLADGTPAQDGQQPGGGGGGGATSFGKGGHGLLEIWVIG